MGSAVFRVQSVLSSNSLPPPYNITRYVLAAMLLGGLICNVLVGPVKAQHYMTDKQLAAERAKAHEQAVSEQLAPVPAGSTTASSPALLIAAWTAVAIPLAWGVWITLTKSFALFR